MFAEFQHLRGPNSDAIPEMALENSIELRDTVRDPTFRLQKALSLELERRFPERFAPRYSMVMFHHEIGYADAYAHGWIEQDLLNDLTRDVTRLDDVNWRRAGEMMSKRLAPPA